MQDTTISRYVLGVGGRSFSQNGKSKEKNKKGRKKAVLKINTVCCGAASLSLFPHSNSLTLSGVKLELENFYCGVIDCEGVGEVLGIVCYAIRDRTDSWRVISVQLW